VRTTAILVILSVTFAAASSPGAAEAGLLYHAASRSAAKSIARSGFRKSLMRSKSRFGAGAYFSAAPRTALREKPAAGSLIAFNKRKGFDSKVLDTRSLTSAQLKKRFHVKDMRGATKNGVIGQKLANRIGRYAGRNDNIVAYRSARDPRGTNYLIPKNRYRPGETVAPRKVTNIPK
jgi:hypothetical protein